MSQAGHNGGNSNHAPDHDARPDFLAHHFDSPEQQHESGKLGMWIFLVTEILLFSGLFCAYAVYRSLHPEVFIYAHKYLDKVLGGVNTVVLICSSLTMAWAVRCAQKGQQRGLVAMLVMTLLFAVGFLGIKAVEYEHKWKHGLLWGKYFHPHEEADLTKHGGQATPTSTGPTTSTQPATTATATQTSATMTSAAKASTATQRATKTAPRPSPQAGQSQGAGAERSTILPAPKGPSGLAVEPEDDEPRPADLKNVRVFFSVYFLMTGLHGLHVIAGMIAIGWVLIRSVRGHFGSDYYTPVDLVGLYWHLVDLIWIFLFPLLYLIH